MNILLCCCAGMSTSLVVSKMERRQRSKARTTRSGLLNRAKLPTRSVSSTCCLLGPQVRHLQRKLTKTVNGTAPVAVIEPTAYGSCNGSAV